MPLDKHYNKPLDFVLHDEFDKAVLALTIDQTKRQKIEIEKQQKKIDEFKEDKTQVALLRQEVADMRKTLEEKGEKPYGYIMVNEKGEPLYYQNQNETTFKKYPKDKK